MQLKTFIKNVKNKSISYYKLTKTKISSLSFEHIKFYFIKGLGFIRGKVLKRVPKQVMTGVAVFGILFSIFAASPTYVSALEVKYNDKVVGYVQSKNSTQKAVESITQKVDGNLIGTATPVEVKKTIHRDITVNKVSVIEDTLTSTKILEKKILKESPYSNGYSLSIDNDIQFIVATEEEAIDIKNELFDKFQAKSQRIDFVTKEKLEITKGVFDSCLISKREEINLDEIYDRLTFLFYDYYTKDKVLNFDIVYVANNSLSLGESKILKEGVKGSATLEYRKTYVNNKFKKKELLNTVVNKYPTAQTIEVSNEEYNILHSNKISQEGNYAFPLKTTNYYVSSLYGWRWGKTHGGIDLATPSGTPIVAYRSGKVVTASTHYSWGNYILIDHGDGLQTLYAHCSKLLSKAGGKVKQGQVIALSGSTGNSTGPHLHFEVRLNGKRVNPSKYLDIYIKASKDAKSINKIKKTIGLSGSRAAFVESIKPAAIEAYQHYNILPSLTIAQAICESGWGKYSIGNNVFGIKAYSDWKGKKSYVWTSEERSNGTKYRCQCWFKNYDSIEESVRDHTKLLLGSRYAKVREANNYREACYAVKAAGYATSSDYPETLINLIETYGLYVWDTVDYKVEGTYDYSTTTSSKATAKAPALKNMSVKKAVKILKQLGLSYKIKYKKSSKVKDNHIIKYSQNKKKVTIVVSKNKKKDKKAKETTKTKKKSKKTTPKKPKPTTKKTEPTTKTTTEQETVTTIVVGDSTAEGSESGTIS